MGPMVPPEADLRRLVDEYRSRCLRFLREDYYPSTPSERERVLDLIATHGDLHAFRPRRLVRAVIAGTGAGVA